ncbi:MAG: type II toxin-antitoxin system PemK/MazF family toxin [Candidatus Bipolaricaulota bacterium]
MLPPFQWRLFRAQLAPVVGAEQAGERPVLVVSHEAINEALPIVTVLPLTTSRPGRRIYPTEILLEAGVAGQPHDSIVLAHQIRTISKARLGEPYGLLQDETLRGQVRKAMRIHLEL